jgi:peptidoglycan/LPS O-acetylase OafA/YrhL
MPLAAAPSSGRSSGRSATGLLEGRAIGEVRARGPVGRHAPQLPSLTGMRWVAAFLVFAYHVSNFGYFGGRGGQIVGWAFGSGFTGVSFFFVLSGFVLAWTACDGDSAWAFWRRRLARIYPVHLVTALVALALAVTVVPGLGPTGPGEVIANLSLVSSWNGAWWQALNPVSWSLTCEAFFYACFPLLFAVLRRLRPRGLAVLVGAAGIAVLLLAWLDDAHRLAFSLNTFPPARFAEFVLGAAAAQLVRLGAWRGPGLDVAVAVTVVGYFLTAQVPHAYSVAAGTLLGFGLLIPAAAVADLTGAPSPWRHRALVRLGEWSFAFYMIHVLVMRWGQQVFGSRPHLAVAPAMAATALAFGAALALARLLHERVELPGRRLLLGRGRRSTRSTRSVAAPARRRRGDGGQVRLAMPAIGLLSSVLVLASGLPAAVLRHRNPTPPGAIVIVGASVSDGYRASAGANWPRLLADRLHAESSPLHVVNASISATRLLTSADHLPSALAREDRDALAVPDVRVVVLTDLINDIQQPPHQYDARVITDGLRRFVDAAHTRGVKVIGTTIPPTAASSATSPRERTAAAP